MDTINGYQNNVTSNQRTIPGLHIRPYTIESIPDVLDITRETLGNSGAIQKTEAFWDWKHHSNRFGQSYGLCAWDDRKEKLAGLRLLMRWRFTAPGGKQIQAVRAVDTATQQNYQRRGIFSTLTKQAVDDLQATGVHLIFNTPNQRSLPGYLKMGWQVVETWPLFMRVFKPIRFLATVVRQKRNATSPPQFEQHFGQDILSFANFVNQYQTDVQQLLEVWEAARFQRGLRTPRDLEYLQWRYGQHPHIQYGVSVLENGGKLAGFVILRPNIRYGLKETVLTEIILMEPSVRLGKMLLSRTFKKLKGDYVVAHFGRHTLERKLLGRTGFIRLPRPGITFTTRLLNPLSQDVFNPTSWDLTLGDLELF